MIDDKVYSEIVDKINTLSIINSKEFKELEILWYELIDMEIGVLSGQAHAKDSKTELITGEIIALNHVKVMLRSLLDRSKDKLNNISKIINDRNEALRLREEP